MQILRAWGLICLRFRVAPLFYQDQLIIGSIPRISQIIIFLSVSIISMVVGVNVYMLCPIEIPFNIN